MPGFDRTGPSGQGPLTGRGFGPCGSGRGKGFGRRFYGFGYGYQVLTSEEKKQGIEEEIKGLEDYLEYLKGELKNLK